MLLILCPLLSAITLLPLAGLFWLFVLASYAVGAHVLQHIGEEEGGKLKWSTSTGNVMQCRWAKWIDGLAGPVHTAVGWLGSVGIFSHVDGILGNEPNGFLEFTSTSSSTLAGGLSCFWTLIAIAPVVSYHAWGQAWSVVMLTTNMTTSNLAWASGFEWASIGSYLAALVVCGMWLAAAWLPRRWRGYLLRSQEDNTRQVILCSLCAIVAVGALLTLLTAVEVRQRTAIAYASSLEVVSTMAFNWDGVLPSFEELAELLSDPVTAISDLFERLSDMSRYFEFDSRYFLKGAQATNALQLALGFVKLVAVYGRKLFALIDTARAILESWGGYKSANRDDDLDGTIQIYQTVTDVKAVRLMLNLGNTGWEALLDKVGWDVWPLELLQLPEVNWHHRGLTDDDSKVIVDLLSRSGALTHLNVGHNNLGPEAAVMIFSLIGKSKYSSLTKITFSFNKIGPEGGKALAQCVSINATMTELDVSFNRLGIEPLAAFASAFELNNLLRTVNISGNMYGYNEDETFAFAVVIPIITNPILENLYLTNSGIGARGFNQIMLSLRGNMSLRTLDLSGNPLSSSKEDIECLIETLRQNVKLERLNLSQSDLELDKLSGDALAQCHCDVEVAVVAKAEVPVEREAPAEAPPEAPAEAPSEAPVEEAVEAGPPAEPNMSALSAP